MGLDDRFLRMWEFYLCYCEGGFEERQIGVVQALFEKAGARRAPVLGALG
jgi:cyclopropane-fatty-acyl-phospholipid synthase